MAGGDLAWVAAIFYGLQPAVVAIVAAAILRIGGKALKNPLMWSVAALAFVAIFFFKLHLVRIIATAAILGLVCYRLRPGPFATMKTSDAESAETSHARTIFRLRTRFV